MIRFASLGSGSRGNALLIEAGTTRVMLDCGFPLRETVRRLGRLGVAPEGITAVIVTHEHADHVGGVRRFASRFGIPVWLTHGTLAALGSRAPADVQVFDCHAAFAICDMCIEPFPVPHDAREPTQFVFGDGRLRLGVLTDVGDVTPHVEAMLSGCDGLVLECNHDTEMLRTGTYPAALKRRIASRFGHLDNDSAARLLGRLDNRRLQHIIAAHLSEENNRPQLARSALCGALGCAAQWIGVADQQTGFAWRSLV